MAHSVDQPVNAGRRSPRGWLWLPLAALLPLVWLRLGLWGSAWWPVTAYEVSAPFNRVTEEMVQKTLAPLIERGFFATDLVRIRDAVHGLPWVAAVEVRRQWPDRLVLTIAEHAPLAYWNDEQLISRSGALIAQAGLNRLQGLPALYGPEGSDAQVLALWAALNDEVQRAGWNVAALHLEARGSWWMTLGNGIRVELGRRDVIRRAQRLIAALPAVLADYPQGVAAFDLRYSNGFAVHGAAVQLAAGQMVREAADG